MPWRSAECEALGQVARQGSRCFGSAGSAAARRASRRMHTKCRQWSSHLLHRGLFGTCCCCRAVACTSLEAHRQMGAHRRARRPICTDATLLRIKPRKVLYDGQLQPRPLSRQGTPGLSSLLLSVIGSSVLLQHCLSACCTMAVANFGCMCSDTTAQLGRSGLCVCMTSRCVFSTRSSFMRPFRKPHFSERKVSSSDEE